jgi:hypothetical protein
VIYDSKRSQTAATTAADPAINHSSLEKQRATNQSMKAF